MPYPYTYPIEWFTGGAGSFLIDGVDYSAYVHIESLVIDNLITNKIDTCSFSMNGDLTVTEESEIIIYNSLGTRLFAGIIVDIQRSSIAGTKFWDVSCQDYTVLLERRLVNRTYVNVTDKDIINDLFATYMVGMYPMVYVEDGISHDRITFNQVKLRDVLDTLSNLSGYDWYVDYNKQLHYFSTEITAAPFNVSTSPDNVTTFPIFDLQYQSDATAIINRVTVIGGTYLSDDASWEFASDGLNTLITLPYKLHAPSGETSLQVYINSGDDVTPNWVLQSIGIDNISDPLTVDVLYNYEEKLLTFLNPPSALLRAVKVTGCYDVPILIRVSSLPSYTLYGRWFDEKIVDTTINSILWATQAAKALLATNAYVKESGSFHTTKDGLFAGMTIHLTDASRSIDDDFLINRVTTNLITNAKRNYTVYFGEYHVDLVDMIISLKKDGVQTVDTSNDVLREILENTETLTLSEVNSLATDDFSSGIVNRWIVPTFNVEHERLTLSEVNTIDSHAKNHYHWGDGTKWGFGSWL